MPNPIDFHFEHLADAHTLHPGQPVVAHRFPHGDSLRVENAFLGHHDHFGFHRGRAF